MEKSIFDLDLPNLFLMLKKHIQAYERMAESFDDLKKMVMKFGKPSFGDLLHIKDVASLLGITPNTVYRYIRSGELVSIKIGNKHVFYEKDIQAFLDKNYKGRGI